MHYKGAMHTHNDGVLSIETRTERTMLKEL